MTQYQERYKRQKEYHRSANLRAELADRRKRRGNSLSPRRSNNYHGYTSDDEGDGNITPENPDILTTEERRRLLEKRIKQLEENERKILELQLKERSSQQHSRYSERSYATSGKRADPEGPKYYFTERYSRTDNPDTFRTDLYDSFSIQDKPEETDEKMKEHAAINKISREYRANILNKAEKMIEDRKRREVEPLSGTNVSRVQEYVNQQQQMHLKQNARKERQNTTFVTKRPRSPLSDSEYIEVPEYIDTDTDVSLGYRIRRKGRSQWSIRDIPSAIQVM